MNNASSFKQITFYTNNKQITYKIRSKYDWIDGDNNVKRKKDSICTELNDMINIPLVSEKKEQACIESVFDAFMDVLEKVLTKEK